MFLQRNFHFDKMFPLRKFHFTKMFRQRNFCFGKMFRQRKFHHTTTTKKLGSQIHDCRVDYFLFIVSLFKAEPCDYFVIG